MTYQPKTSETFRDCKLNHHARHAPTQDEKPYAIEALALGDVDPLWYCESAVKPTREPPEPRIVAFEHADQRVRKLSTDSRQGDIDDGGIEEHGGGRQHRRGQGPPLRASHNAVP